MPVELLNPSYREISRQDKLHEIDKIDAVLPVINTHIAALETRRAEIQGS